MTLTGWTPEPAPFGNATGFDTVALDVQIAIAIAMGMKVYRGEFPEDIQAEQEARQEHAGLRCPECNEPVWDGPRGSKLAKCWNTEGHADGGTLAFDAMSDDEDEREADPLKTITISHDGLSISGHYDGHRSISGYRSSYWLDQLTPDTIVFDVRTLPWEAAKSYAIRGPLLGVDLPEGVVSKLGPIDSVMASVADDYMRHAGTSLEETGAEVQS